MRTVLISSALLLMLSGVPAWAQWQPQESHSKESLRGVSVASAREVWASGTHGTYLVTTDGGLHWTAAQLPGAEALDFRDVEAFGDTAYLLAAGPGEQSRIYKTSDRGAHWQLQFTNHEPKGFLDCMAFWDEQHGIAVGDPVGGHFQLVATSNGGRNWEMLAGPAARDSEALFAASGTCIATQGAKSVWFATGSATARVFRSRDRGLSWQAAETPIVHGSASSGIFSIAFRDARHGVIAGGDYQHPEQGGANLALSDDGGASWTLAPAAPQRYFSAVAYVTSRGGLAAVGSAASAFSEDDLRSWKFLL
ncbi:MAG TPA: YCF48-related protein, partial [Terriglobales bacterium]|nr:YCF48-related protein [Terriglobales bacterium]